MFMMCQIILLRTKLSSGVVHIAIMLQIDSRVLFNVAMTLRIPSLMVWSL